MVTDTHALVLEASRQLQALMVLVSGHESLEDLTGEELYMLLKPLHERLVVVLGELEG